MANSIFSRRNFIRKTAAGSIGIGLPVIKSLYLPDHGATLPRIRDYRRLGRTNALVSDIGSGIPYSQPVLKAVIEAGVNFIETAESYDNGNNEKLIGSVIRNENREKLFVTTKINTTFGLGDSPDDIARRAGESLRRLNTNYIDLFMMHQVQSVIKVADRSFHKACDRLEKEGKIRFRGLSCHGSFWWQEQGGSLEDILMAAINDGRYDVLFFPYNFLDHEMGERILNACKSHDIGTMIMKSNPVSVFENYENVIKQGGKLSILEQQDYETKRRQLEKAGDFFRKYGLTDINELKKGAYRFILTNKNVSTICCRFKNFSDIELYVGLSGTTLDTQAATMLSDFRENLGFLNCRTGCNICEQNCPLKLPVNTILRYYYYSQALKENEASAVMYRNLGDHNALACRNCPGHCEKACPHNVSVRMLMADAHRQLV
ncbi:MAG: aldo/keto reductase [Bacteroidales bacterium]|jgi:predicted aldo/keto reductase-like oxidoreductase|nr:aldo/keto reductase [Bacteroidales bacterium]